MLGIHLVLQFKKEFQKKVKLTRRYQYEVVKEKNIVIYDGGDAV